MTNGEPVPEDRSDATNFGVASIDWVLLEWYFARVLRL